MHLLPQMHFKPIYTSVCFRKRKKKKHYRGGIKRKKEKYLLHIQRLGGGQPSPSVVWGWFQKRRHHRPPITLLTTPSCGFSENPRFWGDFPKPPRFSGTFSSQNQSKWGGTIGWVLGFVGICEIPPKSPRFSPKSPDFREPFGGKISLNRVDDDGQMVGG